MDKWRVLAVSVAALSLCTGASDVAKFFHPVPHRSIDAPTDAEPDSEPGTGNIKDDVNRRFTEGYELIGYSSFNGRESNQKSVVKYAMKLGATLLVVESKFTGTQTAGAIGSTTFTRFGAFSFSSPVTMQRFDQTYLYFRKAPRVGLGTVVSLLTPEEHTQIGTNKGLRISAISNGSPAFKADILPGDIMLSINDESVSDFDTYHAASKSAFGTDARVSLIRNGQQITKSVPLSPDGSW